MTPAARRSVVGDIVEAREGVSERGVCMALGWSRTSVRYAARKPAAHRCIEPMLEVARANPSWGYRRVLREVRARGVRVSRKLFMGFYDQHRLAHRRRKVPKRAKRTGGSPQLRAATRHDIWAVDFMSDQCVNGQRFRLLVVIDEHSRELLALRAARAFRSSDVVKVLDEVRREHGRAPSHLRSDNGPEFIAADLGAWCATNQVNAILSRPGKPVDNAICESNNGRIRAEFLNTTLFFSIPDAAEKAAAFRLHFNHERPHSALAHRTPAAYAVQQGLSH